MKRLSKAYKKAPKEFYVVAYHTGHGNDEIELVHKTFTWKSHAKEYVEENMHNFIGPFVCKAKLVGKKFNDE